MKEKKKKSSRVSKRFLKKKSWKFEFKKKIKQFKKKIIKKKTDKKKKWHLLYAQPVVWKISISSLT